MIPVCKPYWTLDETEAVQRVMHSGRLIQGPEVEAFEQAVVECVQVKYAVATSSGTTALHTALLAMGVGPGDEVLVPAFTFVATANAVVACRARVKLCDIRLDDFCIEPPPQVEQGTRMVSVDAFGVRSKHYGVLEDAACALSPSFRLRGRAAIFSFHATKIITTGEGGMIVTDDPELAGNARRLRDQKHGHGMAYNYRMPEMQGAIGQEQMKKLPWIIKRRAEIAARYDLAFDGKIAARIPPAGNYQSYVLLLDEPLKRQEVIASLANRGVEALPGTQFLGDMSHLKTDELLPNARFAGTHAMRIPIYPQMAGSAVSQVIDAVMEVLG